VEIAVANDIHIPGILEVWKEFMDFHEGIDSSFAKSENGHISFEKHLRDIVKSDDRQALVALDKLNVVGYSIAETGRYPPVFERQTFGLITDMAVKSGYRRQGIGEQMLAKIYQWFESRNLDRIELSVSAKNQIGYSFWNKHGSKDYMHRLYLDRV
jgi:ribosomal protein S18 acetylase RimI-like enzyme